jgi:hypothetical protein
LCGPGNFRRYRTRNLQALVFCSDTDEAGQEPGRPGRNGPASGHEGQERCLFAAGSPGGHKDLSEAWAAGGLQLATTQEKVDTGRNIKGEVAAWPAERREAREEKAAVLEYENRLAHPDAERAAYGIIRGSVELASGRDNRLPWKNI